MAVFFCVSGCLKGYNEQFISHQNAMNILINGTTHHLDNAKTVADLIVQMQPETPFAMAVNTVFVPKSAYENTQLKDGDQVEIVRPVAGG